MVVDVLPTSDFLQFKEMVSRPNVPTQPRGQRNNALVNIKKNVVIAHPSDNSGCGNIRTIIPFTFLNGIFGRSGDFNLMLSSIMVTQPEILQRTRSIWFQRAMDPNQVPLIRQFKENQKNFGYKMVYDIDDFIWHSDEEHLDNKIGLPDYNFGKANISKEVQDACVEIMKMMDTVCVSTKYLGKFISEKFGIDGEKIKVVQNTVPMYMWGNKKKKPIKNKIVKPRVIWTASPTHWNDEKKLKGDMNNAWYDWVRKNVLEDKITYIQMGGLPWFFEDIKDKIVVVPWVHSFAYHQVMKDQKSDFGIGPLVNNHFNMAKSNIKMIEQYAAGSVFIGSVFNDNEFSPYQDCFNTVKEDATVEDIDNIFWRLTEPDVYNDLLVKQYKYMDEKGHYLESEKFVNHLSSLL